MKPIILTLTALAALAQTASGPVTPESPKPASGAVAERLAGAPPTAKDPVIPIELQMEYFRTDGALAHLRAELDKANAEYEAAVNAMVKACGEGSSPTLTQDKKHLFCVAQAPAPKK